MLGKLPYPYYNYNPNIHVWTPSIHIRDIQFEQVKPCAHTLLPLALRLTCKNSYHRWHSLVMTLCSRWLPLPVTQEQVSHTQAHSWIHPCASLPIRRVHMGPIKKHVFNMKCINRLGATNQHPYSIINQNYCMLVGTTTIAKNKA